MPRRAATSSKDSGIPEAGNKAEITSLSRLPRDCLASSTFRVAAASLFDERERNRAESVSSKMAFRVGSEETNVTFALRGECFRILRGCALEALRLGSAGSGAESLGRDFCRRAIYTPVRNGADSFTVPIGPFISQTLEVLGLIWIQGSLSYFSL